MPRMPWRSARRPILVCGAEPLVDQVVGGLREEGRRAFPIDRVSLLDLNPRRIHSLILADPPAASELVAALLAPRPRERTGVSAWLRRFMPPGMRTGRGSAGAPATRRLILMHRRDPPPELPIPAPDSPWRPETFAILNRAARALLNRWPLHLGMDPRYGQRPHLLIVGFMDPAEALLLHALRVIQFGTGRPRISVVCEDSERVAARFLATYPGATRIADLRFGPLHDLAEWLSRPDRAVDLTHPGAGTLEDPLPRSTDPVVPVTLAAVCLADPEGAGLGIAEHLVETLARRQGVSPPVLLETGPAGTSKRTQMPRIEDWDGQIIPVSYLREACRGAVLLEGQGDEVARTIHDHYRDSIAAQGRDPSSEPAGEPWERLSTSYRQANRHQADHVRAKLAAIDARAVPEELVESFVMTPLEVERLAIVEHERWAADRYLDGWSYAPVRDNRLKHHPQLIAYDDLSEPMKDLDRFAVRGLPVLLARQGLGILRLLIVGIPDPNPGCPRGMRLQPLLDRVLDRLIARYPDRVLVLAATLIDSRVRRWVRKAMDRERDIGLFLLMPSPMSRTLAGLGAPGARREFLSLAVRAERRISLNGEADLVRWMARRADIGLIIGDQAPLPAPAKQVRLDPSGHGLAWSFEY